MRLLALLAVVALLAAPALAGDAPKSDGLCTGFGCENMCPLARDANAWRSAGTEAFAVPSRVAKDHAAVVVKNLGKI